MADPVRSAFFLIADISGYTKFLAETEIAHAKGVLEALFDAIIPAVGKPLRISGLQGDAVFAYAVDSDLLSKQALLDLSEKIYCAFAGARERIEINTTCTCAACSKIGELDLKIVLHHGEFVTQKSGDREELAGRDVVTAFRLLKNHVTERTGLSAYLLMTRAAVERMELQDLFAESDWITESYEHIGEVECAVHGLEPAWRKLRGAQRIMVDAEDPLLMEECVVRLPVSADTAFIMLTRPDMRQKWNGAEAIDLDTGGKSRIEKGARYHCHHGRDIFSFEIIDWRPGAYLTVRYSLPMGMALLETDEIVPDGDGVTVRVRFSAVQAGNLLGRIMKPIVAAKLRKLLTGAMEENEPRMLAMSGQLAAAADGAPSLPVAAG